VPEEYNQARLTGDPPEIAAAEHLRVGRVARVWSDPEHHRHYAGNRCQGLLRFFFSLALTLSMRPL
jgi:hypothetical protein